MCTRNPDAETVKFFSQHQLSHHYIESVKQKKVWEIDKLQTYSILVSTVAL
jgi:hypothetical protein